MLHLSARNSSLNAMLQDLLTRTLQANTHHVKAFELQTYLKYFKAKTHVANKIT